MPKIYVEIGERVTFSKTVGEADVYMFAGVTGDLSKNHVNEQAMAKTRYGGRIAHGALLGLRHGGAADGVHEHAHGHPGAGAPVRAGW